MSQQRFPARRPNGTFSVAARFSLPDLESLDRLIAFVSGWVVATSRYTAMLKELASPPQVVVGSESLDVVFEGLTHARQWKDWMVFLVQDVTASNPGIRLLSFYDLVADAPHPATTGLQGES